MDELLEQEVVKKSDQLHLSLSSLISDLNILINDDKILHYDKHEKSKLIFAKLKLLINEFEPSPQLLDIALNDYIENLSNLYLFLYARKFESNAFTNGIGEVIYNLSKIRGFKFITNYFSSDVYLIPKLISIADNLSDDNELFLSLIWLSNLILVPFPLKQINKELTQRLFDFGLRNLVKHSNLSKNQLASSILLSRLLTRSDLLSEGILDKYLLKIIEPEWRSISHKNGSIKLGHLVTLNKLLKRCPGEYIEHYTDFIYDLISIDLVELRYQQEDASNLNLTNLNILYIIKILNKLSRFYLRQPNYEKISIILNNLLNDIMNLMLNKFDSNLRYAMAKSLCSLNSLLAIQALNYQEQLILYLIEQLEIPNLQILFSPYDESLASANIFHRELNINSDEISISKYHTILLFFGYISLNKSLPLHLVPSILSIVHQTLFIEQRRISSVLGGQLRDSSCFAIWALSRMIDQKNFKILADNNKYMMETILFDLIKVSIFDNDLIIRRCGIAVIQEFIGRFGNLLFGNIITHDDEHLGMFIIKFVELFNNQFISSVTQSYNLIDKLIQLGFNKNLFIPMLIENILKKDLNFEIKKLSSIHLKNILQLNDHNWINFKIEENLKIYSFNEILEILSNDDSSIYSISEVISVSSDNKEIILKISSNVESIKFDHHHDSIEKAEGYLKWINYMIFCGSNIKDRVWLQLFNIMRMNANEDLITEFKKFFTNLSDNNISVSEEYFEKICYYIKNNNLILATSIFYYTKFSELQFLQLIGLMETTSIDCVTRSKLVTCLDEKLKYYSINDNIYSKIINLMDDYTVTNQGDVGSKIRYSIVRLINNNFEIFKGLYNKMELKLIRLSGELIDKIRVGSFNLVLKINGIQKSISDLSISQYYKEVFVYYKNNILLINNKSDHLISLSLNFWKGIGFSLGAITATSSIIKESFLQLIGLLESIDDNHKNFIFSDLLKLLKVPDGQTLNTINPRELKTFLMILNLFVKLFESAVKFPVEFNYDALYIRCYNLQINTSNTTRIGLALRVLQYLSFESAVSRDTQIKARKRIIWSSCNHRLNKVRNMSSEILFEILNELSPNDSLNVDYLDSINWDEPPKTLKSHASKLEDLFLNL